MANDSKQLVSIAKSFFADCISGIEAAVVEFQSWIQGKFTLAKDLAQTHGSS